MRSSKISWSEITLFTQATSQLDLSQVSSEDLVFQLLTLTGSYKFLVGVDSIPQPFFSVWMSENSLRKGNTVQNKKKVNTFMSQKTLVQRYMVTLEPMSAKIQLILRMSIFRKKKEIWK